VDRRWRKAHWVARRPVARLSRLSAVDNIQLRRWWVDWWTELPARDLWECTRKSRRCLSIYTNRLSANTQCININRSWMPPPRMRRFKTRSLHSRPPTTAACRHRRRIRVIICERGKSVYLLMFHGYSLFLPNIIPPLFDEPSNSHLYALIWFFFPSTCEETITSFSKLYTVAPARENIDVLFLCILTGLCVNSIKWVFVFPPHLTTVSAVWFFVCKYILRA